MTLTALPLAIISKIYSSCRRTKTKHSISRITFTLAEALIAIVSDLKQTFYFRDDSVSHRQERVRENKMFAFAFTLAEILIVLGIIGLIADMTIPTLIQNVGQVVIKSQLKKQYSVINGALMLAKAQMGYDTPCNNYDDASGCKDLKPEFIKQLKIIKHCIGNSKAKGCIPDYKGNDELMAINNPDYTQEDMDYLMNNCGGWKKSSLDTKVESYILNDGTIIMEYPYRGESQGMSYLAIDVNGQKKPNKWGHDIFFFFNSDKKGVYMPDSSCGLNEKGSKSTKSMLYD